MIRYYRYITINGHSIGLQHELRSSVYFATLFMLKVTQRSSTHNVNNIMFMQSFYASLCSIGKRALYLPLTCSLLRHNSCRSLYNDLAWSRRMSQDDGDNACETGDEAREDEHEELQLDVEVGGESGQSLDADQSPWSVSRISLRYLMYLTAACSVSTLLSFFVLPAEPGRWRWRTPNVEFMCRTRLRSLSFRFVVMFCLGR